MAEPLAIHVPRENVNDESVRLLLWRAKSGDVVKQGQILAELETSKATFELPAPADGVLSHSVKEGQEVAVGGVLCHLYAEGTELRVDIANGTPPTAAAYSPTAIAAIEHSASSIPHIPVRSTLRPAPRGTRISPLAMRMIDQRGLNAKDFADRGLIRVIDVLVALGEKPAVNRVPSAKLPNDTGVAAKSSTDAAPAQPRATPALPPPVPAVGVAYRSEALTRAKRIEGRYLASGMHHTLASVITVACPTCGLRAAAASYPQSGGSAAGVILFELARLLRKYPLFNAFHTEGTANLYAQVNLGFAVDAGRGLKVPVIREADQKDINCITNELQDLLVAYLDDKLPIESLAGGTFTVTDLSGEGVYSFHPLINQGQSAILGIGAEFFPPGSSAGMFNLILAFDHQLTEGRAAAKFLTDLRDRLAGYEAAINLVTGKSSELSCSRCASPLSDLKQIGHYLLQSIEPGGSVIPICSACISGVR